MALPNAPNRHGLPMIDFGLLVDGAFQWCLDQRLITRVSVADGGRQFRAKLITVEFEGGRHRGFSITEEELANGETERWLEVVMREICLEQMAGWREGAARTGERLRAERYQRSAVHDFIAGMAIAQGSFLGAAEGLQTFASAFRREGNFREDDAAEKKAEALFVDTAGQEAHDVLERGDGLAMKGSAGGDYLLHKKRSYCVTRVADGAKLCAVVPGVPLWDHLLGVKLTIEHDEPEFLRKANVAGGTVGVSSFHQGVPDPNGQHFNCRCRSVIMPAHVDTTATDGAITQRRPG